MKTNRTWLLTPLLTLALYGLAVSAESAATKTAPAPSSETKEAPRKTKKPTALRFRGQITALDAKTGTLSVKSDVSEKNFSTQDSAKESIARMTVGDRVKVTYTDKEGKLFASSVRRLKVKNANTTTKNNQTETKSDKEATAPSKTPTKDTKAAAK
ncbi:MAG: hypothetical protein FJ145_12190 [Deltaproteobacteria bacterium]|nr:hypothetical protein [Deltaproteobacteria bacterium]